MTIHSIIFFKDVISEKETKLIDISNFFLIELFILSHTFEDFY